MKKLILAVALLGSGSALAGPVNIVDNYVGGNDHGYGDVIGNSSLFDISSVDVELNGTLLSMTFNTVFQQGNGLGSYSGLTNTVHSSGNGIGFGDLFLSSSNWTPAGIAPWDTDDHSNGTVWEYGISLFDRWDGVSTGAALYALNPVAGNPDALLSEDFLSGGTFRNGQEVAVNTSTASFMRNLGSNVSTAGGQVSFLLDISGTNLVGSDYISFHWGLTCANDVIEGGFNVVPEPSALMSMLMGVGLMGFVNIRRKYPVRTAASQG